jgi:hypothetical protein
MDDSSTIIFWSLGAHFWVQQELMSVAGELLIHQSEMSVVSESTSWVYHLSMSCTKSHSYARGHVVSLSTDRQWEEQ